MEKLYNNIDMHMPHKEMLDVTMPLYDMKSHKIRNRAMYRISSIRCGYYTVHYSVAIIRDRHLFVGKLVDSNYTLVDYAYISTHYSILFSMHLLFSSILYNWISLICT